MVRLKDLSLQATSGLSMSCFVAMATKYNPLINYDWSTVTAQEYKTDGVELVGDMVFGYNTDASNIIEGNDELTLQSTVAGRYIRIVSTVALSINIKYQIKYNILDKNATVTFGHSCFSNGTGEVPSYNIPGGENTIYFTPTRDNSYITFIIPNTSIGDYVTFEDNVSVQKVIEEPNKRYLKDVGSAPTYNASMYFGRGAYLNGVDQTITVPINTTIQTALKRVKGVVTINETSQTLTNYVISGLGVHKDYYLFTRLLTTAEKESYTNTPELFYTMAQADSTCVLNMPMCETDGYVRNMKSYSEGSNLTTNGTFDTLTGWSLNTNALDGVTNTNNTLNYSNEHGSYAETKQVNKAIVGMYYLVIFDVVSKVDSTESVFLQFGRTSLPSTGNTSNITTGTKTAVVRATHTDGFSISVMSNGIIEIDNVKTYQLSGAYPITNYTSSVRDNAKNLQYGLQTCKFVRDSLGVIQSASNYLEFDGTGYANTGWIPSSSEDWSIEQIRGKDTFQVFDGIWSATGAQRLAIGTEFNGNIRIDVGSINKYISPGVYSNIKTYIVVSYKYLSKTVVIYENGIVKHNFVTDLVTGTTTFPLGRRSDALVLSNAVKRLFKVHNKVLTQEEVTKNYNSYVAKGLLS